MEREQARKTTIVLVVAIIFLSAAVFIVDLLLPLGVADGVLYVAPVALSLWLPGRRFTMRVGASCAFLTVLGFFLSPPGNELLVFVLLNRAYSLIAIGMILLVDQLQRQLLHRNVELATQTMTLEALYEIGTGLSALLDVGTIKETAVQSAHRLFQSDIAGLAIHEEDTAEMRWHLLGGPDGENLDKMKVHLGQGVVSKTIQSGQPVIVNDAKPEMGSKDLVAANPVLAEVKLRAVLVVPIRIAGKPVGALIIGYHAPHTFHLNDLRLLTGLANQVAVAINTAHLHERLRALSAMEERQRLAREMHDGLAQLLGTVTARATATGELLAQGNMLDAQGQLGRLRESAQKAYLEVRQSILGLRTPSPHAQGLLEALNDYVGRLNEQQEMSIEMISLEETHFHDLSPAVEVQAIRIIQEALNNVQKHSQAKRASININRDSEWLTITIQDDGQGFDIGRTYDLGSHFGLQMMRERAESVGGRLSIKTALGQGTLLTVQLPVETREVKYDY
ncbi:MAG: GAF domain-containing protein [Chloroflexi bacterium]|nr:GAF domain-containing protein [Chloroflexota bacterium]